MLIAVDGYNFIKQSPCLRALERVELQKAREKLIDLLKDYKKIKRHAICVVFDGSQEMIGRGFKEHQRGIEVIFSRPGEKADDVLKSLAAEKREGLVIVTSDREIARFAVKKGATAISVEDFSARMQMAGLSYIKGEDEGHFVDRPLAPSKKGPAHKLPKSKRRAELSFKKL